MRALINALPFLTLSEEEHTDEVSWGEWVAAGGASGPLSDANKRHATTEPSRTGYGFEDSERDKERGQPESRVSQTAGSATSG